MLEMHHLQSPKVKIRQDGDEGGGHCNNIERQTVMSNPSYEYLIVGSGAGGATLARELAKRGQSVMIVEKGQIEASVGTFLNALKYFDANKITRVPKKSKQGVIIWHTFMAGGTTMVAAGNGVRCLERELAEYGINLEEEFIEAEREMGIAPLPDSLLSPGGQRIRKAAQALGHQMEVMPKFIDPEICKACGHCSLGCSKNAKWTALNYLLEAQRLGVTLMLNTTVEHVVIHNGKATGVAVKGPGGETEIHAAIVILAAGGIGTPIILQKTGITEAGNHLFVDLLVNTYGVTDDFGMLNEPQMALVDLEHHATQGFLLSTYINHSREVRLIELGLEGYTLPTNRLIGIMTKIADEASGQVFADGKISKAVSVADHEKLGMGTMMATEILIRAGARPDSIRHSLPQGAHVGGTAAIGHIVNSDLRTEIPNLYVCDASVLPRSPGLPPILTIVALGKRLAHHLMDR